MTDYDSHTYVKDECLLLETILPSYMDGLYREVLDIPYSFTSMNCGDDCMCDIRDLL